MKGKIRILPKILSSPETPENPEGPEKPSIGKPFPEELKDKIIYKEITKDAALIMKMEMEQKKSRIAIFVRREQR